ncbi:hypothetical protein ROSINTL182_08917 [Roseburia intestinalis L1-82]|uniref:Uncharacterized protein n=1 Tax=Roseburia intestinalis L1-82 TaxID=536231 RepID=C7GG55_9FIRM|nr:hypothetical protein ROSINTL182_08917 [Roseburia intestinalis L1-82]
MYCHRDVNQIQACILEAEMRMRPCMSETEMWTPVCVLEAEMRIQA